jgi:hypothetical protein
MENKNVCGLQVNYRRYLIKKQNTIKDGLTTYELEFNTNSFTLAMDKEIFELRDQNKIIVDSGLTTSIKWLIYDVRPEIQ